MQGNSERDSPISSTLTNVHILDVAVYWNLVQLLLSYVFALVYICFATIFARANSAISPRLTPQEIDEERRRKSFSLAWKDPADTRVYGHGDVSLNKEKQQRFLRKTRIPTEPTRIDLSRRSPRLGPAQQTSFPVYSSRVDRHWYRGTRVDRGTHNAHCDRGKNDAGIFVASNLSLG